MPVPQPQAKYVDPGIGVRLVRSIGICVVGLVMLFTSLGPHGDSMGNQDGWAYQHLGPHGNAIMGVIVGSLFALLGGWMALRTIRLVRADRARYKSLQN